MSFKWGTVTAVGPLRVRLDGDIAEIPVTPDSLVDPLTLEVDDRVRVEFSSNRLVVLGKSGGAVPGLVSGAIDPYFSDGPVDVTIDGVLHKGLSWVGDAPVGGSTAAVASLGGELVVLGAKRTKAGHPKRHLLDIESYGQKWYPVSTEYARPTFTKTSAGWVSLAGLMIVGSFGAGDLMAVLPPGFRPLIKKRFSTYGGNQAIVEVHTNGEIRLLYVASTLLGLNNIAFTTDTSIVWTYPTLLSTFVTAEPGREVRYGVDSAGRHIMEGIIKGGAAGTKAFDLPSGMYSPAGHIIISTTEGVSNSSIYLYSDGRVIPQAPGGALVSRSMDFSWWPQTTGWMEVNLTSASNYGSGFRTAALRITPDNTVALRGLISVTTTAVRILGVPIDVAPRGREIFNIRATDTIGRADIDKDGIMNLNAGTGSWVSLDSIQYAIERSF